MSARLVPLTVAESSDASRRLAWLAVHPSGHPLGSAFLRLFSREGQEHLAELDLTVHPAERRHGVGSMLLDAAVGAAHDDGRRSVVAEADGGSPGEAFLAARGFRAVLALTYARLALREVDPESLSGIVAEPHPGYELTSWAGTVPDELAESFTRSRRAMDDMPMDDTDYGTVTWDAERVRAVAAAVDRRGDLLHTVAAIEQHTGDVVAFTELVVSGDGTGDGQHYGTGVLPEHRGHGLGRWMKARSILEARERHPRLERLLVDTADSNVHMRAINDALGYHPTHRTVHLQLDL